MRSREVAKDSRMQRSSPNSWTERTASMYSFRTPDMPSYQYTTGNAWRIAGSEVGRDELAAAGDGEGGFLSGEA